MNARAKGEGEGGDLDKRGRVRRELVEEALALVREMLGQAQRDDFPWEGLGVLDGVEPGARGAAGRGVEPQLLHGPGAELDLDDLEAREVVIEGDEEGLGIRNSEFQMGWSLAYLCGGQLGEGILAEG